MNETTELIMKQLNAKKVHAETHELGGGDEIDVTKLKNVESLETIGHSAKHEIGGSDEIDVMNLRNVDNLVTKTGDFQGTWNGITMTSTEPGLSSAFDALKADTMQRGINVMYPPAPLVAAKGDGVSDDASVLNTIFTNYRGKIQMPFGVYLVSTDLTVNSNTVLSGDGRNRTIIKIKNNSTAGTVATHGVMYTEDSGTNITIENLTVDGNMANQSWLPVGSANYGIAVRSTNTVVRNVECKNVTGNGCGVPVHASNVIFDQVFSHDNGKKGLHSGLVDNIQITNGFYYNNGIDSGIGIHQGMKKVIVSNNHCFNNGTYGIHFGDDNGVPSYDIICTGNKLYGNTLDDMNISGRGNDDPTLLEKKAIISNNSMGSCMMQAVRNVLFVNNMLTGTLRIQTSFRVVVRGNTILNPPNTMAAIKVEGVVLSATNLTVGDNIDIMDNEIDIGTISVPYGIEVAGHTNVKIADNTISGTPATHLIRIWDKAETSYIKSQKGPVRIEGDVYSVGFNNYDFPTSSTTATRHKKPRVGVMAYDSTLNKPIWCKTAAVIDGSGTVTTPAVWVDATGATV